MCQPRPGNRCATDLRKKIQHSMEEFTAAAKRRDSLPENSSDREVFEKKAMKAKNVFLSLSEEMKYTPEFVNETKLETVKESDDFLKEKKSRELRDQKDVRHSRSEFAKIAVATRKAGDKGVVSTDAGTSLIRTGKDGSKVSISVRDVDDGDTRLRVSKVYGFKEGRIPEENMRRTRSDVTVRSEADGNTAYYNGMDGDVIVGERSPHQIRIVAPGPADPPSTRDAFVKARNTPATVNDDGVPFTASEKKMLSRLFKESGYTFVETKDEPLP